jgi:putative addiction module killer protein
VEIKETEEFSKWLKGLRDAKAKAKVVTRLLRLADGNPGDVGPVGDGISELRIDFGPGYRVYYVQSGRAYVALCGGDKSTQTKDISSAKALAAEKKAADRKE